MSVSITLNQTSHLLITFSGVASKISGDDSIVIRAWVDDLVAAYPGNNVPLTESSETSAHSFTFYLPNGSSGSHTVTLQWRVLTSGAQGVITHRTLTVLGIPA
jgi:hypothetical protein